MTLYPLTELLDMAIAKGLEITPELTAILSDAYELGVQDTY